MRRIGVGGGVIGAGRSGRGPWMALAAALCLPWALAACSTVAERPVPVIAPMPEPVSYEPAPVMAEPLAEPEAAPSEYEAMYGAVSDGGNEIAALDLAKIDARNLRREVDYATNEPVGTIVVDPYARYLYLVQPGGRAMRYSVGVGRAGLVFHGEARVGRKARWPRWTPTANMIKRNPDHYAKHAAGLEGGIRNPLGARALYLFRDGRDTLYRIHGTNEPWSIGRAASSGCIRLFNQDILDLYERVSSGARVVVLDKSQSGKGTS